MMKHLLSHITALGMAVLVTGCATTTNITNYQDCVNAGHAVRDTNPPSCVGPDGTVYRQDVAKEAGVRLLAPQTNAELRSLFTVSGEARGTWFFEGVLTVAIEDMQGNVLLQKNAEAEDDWMTEDYVPFSVEMTVPVTQQTAAAIVVRKSNPSGLPEHAAEVRVPVTLLPSAASSASMSTDTTSSNQANANWETYTNTELGIRLEHPAAMTIEPITEGPEGNGVQLHLWGPTQTEGTELFDGVSMTIRPGTYAATLEAYVNAQVESALQVGEITNPLHTVPFAGVDTFVYTATTLGTHTHYYLPTEGNTYLHISTIYADPSGQGYQALVQRMLDSFALL